MTRLLLAAASLLAAQTALAQLPKPDPDDGGIQLPPGFRALVVADELGPLRFMTVGSPEVALRESFADAMAGLGAAKGVLIHVRQEAPAEVEILYARGLSPEDETSCRSLESCPGISPSLIRKTIETREARLIENSSCGNPDATLSLRVRAYSVLCAPVSDSLTDSVMAVLYFQNEARFPFRAEDLEWLTAYAAALGQALTLHVSGQQHIQALEAEWRHGHLGGPEIVGDSEATCKLGALLNRLLPSTAHPEAPPILVLGESGTGKDLVARYLHHFSPKRSRGPFVTFNCAAMRGELAESKLFGHTRGAFTGAIGDAHGLFRTADKGVLFLDSCGVPGYVEWASQPTRLP